MICSPHSQAHLQFAQANAQPKITRELVCPATAFLPTLKTNLFGNSSASTELVCDYKRMIMNQHQYIKYLIDTANFKVAIFNVNSSSLTIALRITKRFIHAADITNSIR